MNRFQYRDEVDRANTIFGCIEFLHKEGLADETDEMAAAGAGLFLNDVGVPCHRWGSDFQDVRLAE